MLNSIFSINKELSNSAKLSKLSLSTFDNISKMIDKYNKQVVGSEVNKENWDNQPTLSTFRAYTQQLSTDERATREGYDQFISQYSTGLTGVANTINQYNKLAEKGIATQNEYAKAIATTNPKLGSYLTNLNGAKAGMSGYAKQLAGATLKTVGLQAATMALDAALSMGISFAISAIIKGIDLLVHAQENAIEKGNEATRAITEQQEALYSNKKAINEISGEYQRLSKGVSTNGENISLTSDEYSRYNEIVNQIADMFPSMIQGYTEEGNAILKNKGNVEALTKAYEENRKAALADTLTKSDDIIKGAKAKLTQGKNFGWQEWGDTQKKEMLQEVLDAFSNGQSWTDQKNNSKYLEEQVVDVLKEYGLSGYYAYFDPSQFDEKTFEEVRTKINAAINTLSTDIDTKTAELKPILQAYLENSSQYNGYDDTVKGVIKKIVDSLDSELYIQFLNDKNPEQAMNNWLNQNIYNAFDGFDGRQLAKKFNTMLNVQTDFQNNKSSVGDYQEGLTEFLKEIDDLDPNIQKSIKLIFGISSEDGSTDVDTMIDNILGKVDGITKEDLLDFNYEDLQIAYDLSPSDEAEEEMKKLQKGGSVDLLVRPLIDTSELANKGWDVDESGTATLYTNTFSNTDFAENPDSISPEDTVAINFTPIFVDPTTGETSILTEDELRDYAERVINGAEDTKQLQIGKKYTGENAIEKASDDAEKIHELQADYYGLSDEPAWNLDEFYNKLKEAKKKTEDSVSLNKELNDSLDKIQSAYQVASTAIEEYNENGYISVDTFQSLMELEPEYLNLLMDENGTLALTSENLYKLTEARINDLAAKQASTLVDSVTKLGSEAEQLDYLTQSTKEATESTWGLVYAKIAEAQAAGTISDDVAGRLKSRVDAYQTWAKNTIDGINKGSLGKSSNSSKSEKDKAKALKDYNDKLKDINEKLEELDKEEHLANLKYSIETITQDLDTFEKSLDRLSSKLDLTFEKDYSAKLSIIGQQFLGASRYGGEMRVELERLLAIEPQTADEAEELASRLESLSDSFFENEKNIIEYRNSLFETATDYLGESASATVEQVNNAKSILDNTFNVIKNGSLSGDGFWSATLLPSISKDKVTKQRAENNKLIKEEKRYQNAIAKIRKKATDMSYAEEKEEREKQRQEYQEELQEAYEDYQDKINDVIGQNIEVSDSVKNIGDEYMNTADKAENAAQRMSDAMNNINWEQRSYANKSYTYEDGAPTSAQYQYAYGDSKSTVVVTKKAKGGTTSQGLTITGDGTGAYAGQEAYIGQDGKLHLFNNEAQLSELPPNTRIVNAKDLQNIIKYTGMKYFYQPIENIQSATVDKFAQGNTNVSFSPIPYNTLSTQALYSDVDVQAMVEETIAEINNEFNALKGNIKFSAVQNAFKNSLTDKKMYKDLSNTIVNMTSQSLDKADKSTLSDSVVGLILQNSAWDDLPNELQNKLSELNVNADNWTDWIKDSNNSLQAFNLMQDGGMSSWDLLDSNVTSLLQQAGINGKDAWDKFVQDDPLQALTLLSSSWNSMNDTIGQYMTDAKTIAANGARAIQSLQIIAPSISEQSWNALQVLIANKIQEIISLMNEVFGENTVD
ncbi:Uncharacterised protein [uncultured Clostridium sp.]|nr:Uncharacterised protein [uncultured Clostridium sp.]